LRFGFTFRSSVLPIPRGLRARPTVFEELSAMRIGGGCWGRPAVLYSRVQDQTTASAGQAPCGVRAQRVSEEKVFVYFFSWLTLLEIGVDLFKLGVLLVLGWDGPTNETAAPFGQAREALGFSFVASSERGKGFLWLWFWNPATLLFCRTGMEISASVYDHIVPRHSKTT